MLRLAADLTAKYGRGFSQRNVEQMRAFYLNCAIGSSCEMPGFVRQDSKRVRSGSGHVFTRPADAERAHERISPFLVALCAADVGGQTDSLLLL